MQSLSEALLLQTLTAAVDNERLGVALLQPVDKGTRFRFLHANHVLTGLADITSPVGLTLEEVWPDHGPAMSRFLQRVLASPGEVVRNEQVLEDLSGTRVIEATCWTLDAEGQPLVACALVDRTAEKKILEQATLLDEHIEKAPLAIIEFDTEFRISRWTGEAERIFGYSSDEMLGRKITDLRWVYEDDVPLVEAETERLYSGVVTRSKNVNRNYRKDGTVIWCEWYSSVLHDEQGNLRSVLSRVLDITDRVEAEQRIKSERKRLQTLLDTVPMGIIIVDSQGAVEYVNRTADEIWAGAPRVDDVSGYVEYKAWWSDTGELLRPEDWAAARALGGEPVLGQELEIERLNGEHGFILNSAAPIVDDDGHVTGTVAVFQDITEHQRSRMTVAQQASRMAALKDIAYVASSALEPRELAQRLAAAAHKAVGARNAVVALVNQRAEIEALAQSSDAGDLLGRCHLMNDCAARRAAAEGSPQFLNDLSAMEADLAARQCPLGGKSVAALPLLIEGSVIGMLSLSWDVEHTFEPDERTFLLSMAAEMAVGLQNAKLFQRERVRRRRIEALHGVLEVAVSQLDVAEAAQRILEYLVEQHGFELANTWLARGESLELLAAVGYPSSYRRHFSPMSLTSDYDAPKVYRADRPVVVTDLMEMSPAVREMYEAIGIEVGAYVIVPLRARGKTVGTLHFGWHEPRTVSAEDVAFYESLGTELGVVLDNAELLRERTEQVEYAEALNRINEAVHSTLDFDEIMRRVVLDAAEVGEFGFSAVHLRQAEGWRWAYAHGLPEEFTSLRLTDEQATISSLIVSTRDMIVVDKAREDARVNRELLANFNFGSVVGLPLMAKNQVVGVLFTGWMEVERPFSNMQIDFMRKVASTVSLAIENARLYDVERTIADRLQEALLTLPAEVRGVEFAHFYRSATETSRVGGDFYDLFEIDKNLIGIVMGDVAGKGIDAAVLTSLVKNTIRAHAFEKARSPEHVLALANEVLYDATPLESFVTVFYAVIDKRDGRLCYASAGHTTTGLLGEGGEARPLGPTGPLLGAFRKVRFRKMDKRLSHGDVLFLFTDGLVEARGDEEMYGEARLFGKLAQIEDRSPERILEEVTSDVERFSGGHLQDDVAVLVVRFVAEEARSSQLELEV